MFKTKNFLIGLGFGLIFSSFLLIFVSGPTVNEEWSIERVKEYAENQGLYLYTQDEVNELLANAKKDEKENQNQEESSQNNGDMKKPEQVVEKSFSIPNGLSSQEVASFLKDLGILKDEKEFNRLLRTHGLTRKIIATRHTYEGEITTVELIELITDTKQENWK